MSDKLIADHWAEIERQSDKDRISDEQLDLARGLYMAGAMAAFHAMTGWDPESDNTSLEINYHNIALLFEELTEAYRTGAGELYAEVVH
ncbi:hypothetical protein [Bradyrhizobium sp. Tv2a-2]|uniref:hypothetical protein n=1 Tax=Bradyrhizobium sp. Tv2a-2 TaxID=113395 RepID=UPI000467DFCD|nr:hypothetical protein [Bradyrhizobium sp. Tv2a-2]